MSVPRGSEEAAELRDRLAGMLGLEAIAERLQLPLPAGPEHLRHRHRGEGHAAGEGVAGQLGVVLAVDQAAEGVLDLFEGVALVGGDDEEQGGDVRGHPGQIDQDHLVVAVALAGQVVALVAHRAVLGRQLTVVGEVGRVAVGEHDDRGVEVDVDGAVAEHAARGHRVPAKAHLHEGQRGAALLAQGDPLALLQADRTVLAQADLTGRRGRALRVLLRGRRVATLRRILLRRRRIPTLRRIPGLVPVLRGRDLLGRRRGRLRGRALLRRGGIHVHAVIGDQRGESARIALTDRAHLPRALPAVHLERDDDRLQVQAVDPVLVEPRARGVGDDRGGRGECAEAGARVVEGDDRADLVDVGRDLVQVDRQRGGLPRRTGHQPNPRTDRLVVEDEIRVRAHLAPVGHQQGGQIRRRRQLHGNDQPIGVQRTVLPLGECCGQGRPFARRCVLCHSTTKRPGTAVVAALVAAWPPRRSVSVAAHGQGPATLGPVTGGTDSRQSPLWHNFSNNRRR